VGGSLRRHHGLVAKREGHRGRGGGGEGREGPMGELARLIDRPARPRCQQFDATARRVLTEALR